MSLSEAYHAQKLERVGLITSSVAHDFNNLLTSIIGHLSMAARALPEAHEAHTFVNKALRSADRATDLVKHLLEFTAKGSTDQEQVDVNAFIRDLQPLFKWVANEQITIQLELLDKLPPVLMVKTHLQQLLMNLVTNAIDAIQPEKGTITVTTSQTGRIETPPAATRLGRPRPNQRYICIRVSDTGQGMSPETIRKITTPFFTTKEKGYGLGLAILSHLVDSYEAVCHIESEEGAHTRFSVYLPATTPE